MSVQAPAAPPLEKLVKQSCDLDALPHVARKVLQLVSEEGTNAAQIRAVIEKDQALAAEVLRICNSAYYGLRGEVNNLQHAVIILGYETLRCVVVAASARGLNRRFGPREKQMWEHSLGVAAAAKLIAERYDVKPHDSVYIGGLLHDIGKVFMNNASPGLYGQVIDAVSEGASFEGAEDELFGYAHPKVGADVVWSWSLPPLLTNIISCHHSWVSEEATSDKGRELYGPIAAVALADDLCEHLGIGYPRQVPFEQLARSEAASYLGLNTDAIEQLIGPARERIDAELGALGG